MNRQETESWMERIPPCASALEGQDIVVFSLQRWDTHFTCIHGTALRLAQRNRVLFMEPPESFTRLLRNPADRRALGHLGNPLEMFGDSLGLYHTPPLFLPLQARSKLILHSLNVAYRRMVQEGMRRMQMSDPIFWLYQFQTVGVVEALNPKLTVYECPEDAAEFTTRPHLQRYVRDMDARLCRRADIVIVPNSHMYNTRREISRQILMYPWAADFEHYNRALDPNLAVPPDLECIARPIIGFYGNVDACRFDVDLVLTLARRHPEWSFVVVGRLWPGFDPKPLRQTKNFHLLGMKPLETLPAYIKGFDVGIIPYALNGFTRSITPLKLIEYLATGKPVVSTALPAALDHADVLRVAHNVDEFEAHVSDALQDPTLGQEQRLTVAREHNWDNYMKRKTEAVNSLLRVQADGDDAEVAMTNEP